VEKACQERAATAPATAAAPAPSPVTAAAAAAGGAAKAQKAHRNSSQTGVKGAKRQKTVGKASGTKTGLSSEGVSGGGAAGSSNLYGATVYKLFDIEGMEMPVHNDLDVLACAADAVAVGRGGVCVFAGAVGIKDLTTLAETSYGQVELAAPGSAGQQPLLLPAAPAVGGGGGAGGAGVGVGGGFGGQLPKLPSVGGGAASLAVGIAAAQPAVPVVQLPVAPAPAVPAAAAAAVPGRDVIEIDSDMEDEAAAVNTHFNDLTAGSDSDS